MRSSTDNRRWIILALAALTLVLLSPLASNSPDGLEWVAEVKGFFHRSGNATSWNHAPMPDYAVPAVEHESGSTLLSGAVGVLLVMGFSWLLMKGISHRQRASRSS